MGDKNKKWLEDGKDNSRNFPQGQRVYSPNGDSAQLTAQGGGWGAKTGLYEVKRTPLKFLERNQKNIEGDYAYTVDGANTGRVEISSAQPRCGDPKKGGTGPLRSTKYSFTLDSQPHIVNRIRRLTPVECERLQGFPDNWTFTGIIYNTPEYITKCSKKGEVTEEYVLQKISDTQRYKMCGNSVSVPVIKAIAERIKHNIQLADNF